MTRAAAALVAIVCALAVPATSAAADGNRDSSQRARDQAAGEKHAKTRARKAAARRRKQEPRAPLEEAERLAVAAAPHAARGIVSFLLLGGVLVAFRARFRRRRTTQRFTIKPFSNDEAGAERVRLLLETWHQLLLERRHRRAYRGQPSMALETVLEPDGQGGFEVRLRVAVPARMAPSLESTLRSCYPNCRIEPYEGDPPAAKAIVRLQKRERFIQALATPEDEDPNAMDSLLGALNAVQAPCVVQLALTPCGPGFDRFARFLYRKRERAAGRRRNMNRADPGTGSTLIMHELRAGLELQNRPLFFADVRVGAPTKAACYAVAGVIRGSSAGQNRLDPDSLHVGGRRRIYRERIRRGWGNPLPGWLCGVYSSAELPSLWRLPSPSLTTVSVARSALPRVDAPSAVSRAPEHALLRDERGPVGIKPHDKTDGLGLIGGQKTGKTSVLCRSVQVDANDPDCALVVLMPKPGDAIKALSTIPKDRTVHYLDFEAPELGINPLMAAGDPAMVADKVVEAFRDINMEGDIRGSSDRYLRQAAQAAIGAVRAEAIEGPPTLWHMYRMLLPSETAFRDTVVDAIYGDPRYTDTATFFGRDLPNDLRDALVNTTSKLDAPRNKILRLMVESLDKVLRHPRQLDLDAVVRNREILVVDGKMGTFGADNCRVMMQFILNMLYGTLQRQQQLPEAERVRVAVKIDEAHLIINTSFADALATLRSGGLEVVAAWQYGEQIEDPKIRAGMMSLLRQRCMFSMGETQDARAMSEITMSVYTDMIHSDPESRARMRVTPDMVINLPNHNAICSWIADGARVPGFVAQTFPLAEDPEVIEHHRAAQRERGGFVPDRLPHPLPMADDGVGPASVEAAGVAVEREAVVIDESRVRDFVPNAEVVERPNERETDRPAEAAPTFSELDFDDVTGVAWDTVDVLPPVKRHRPSRRELEILAALWEHQHLLASQIHRRWWPDSTLRACQQGLSRMAKAGWVKRFRFTSPTPHQRIYVLTADGFALAKQHSSSRGPYVDPNLKWLEPRSDDPRAVLRDLHANAWILALEARAPKAVRQRRGSRSARVAPPRPPRKRGQEQPLTLDLIPLGGSRRLRDPSLATPEPVYPAGAVELRVGLPGEPVVFDLLIDIVRGRRACYDETRARRYDLLVSGWFRMIERYAMLGLPPVVVFVCEDERQQLTALKTADRVVTTRVAEAGVPEVEWAAPGRRQLLWVVERDLHDGRLDALALPLQPPDVRVRLEGRGAVACRPRNVQIVDPRLLDLVAAGELAGV